MTISRRKFLKSTAGGAAAATAVMMVPTLAAGKDEIEPVEAKYWKPLEGKVVQCRLCPTKCKVPDGGRGLCKVRENKDGKYYTLVHSRPCSIHGDPIEKKPLFHYMPGSMSFSMATAGCNFSCKFCQNWEISQFPPEEIKSIKLSPQSLVDLALKDGSSSIAFTYSEPTVFYEYMYDTAKLARENGLGAVTISNGYIRKKPLKALLEYVDGYKVDFKAFTESFYSKVCSGHLKPVLNTLQTLAKSDVWFELVNLIVPNYNDSPDEIRAMSRWIKQELGPDVPLHFTRFHPTYKLTNLPPTPVKTLERCREIAMESGLHFVYSGNVLGHPGENTYCPHSGKLLIKRMGFKVVKNLIKNGKCPCCDKPVPGKWK